MQWRVWVAVIIAACSPRTQPPRSSPPVAAAPIDAGVVDAHAELVFTPGPVAPVTASGPWVRMQYQEPHLCVRLADGTLVRAAFDAKGFRAATRFEHQGLDAICNHHRVGALSAQGEVRDVEGHVSSVLATRPGARSLGLIARESCWVDDKDQIACRQLRNTRANDKVELLNKLGAVDHLTPTADCAVYRDGRVACVTPDDTVGTEPIFSNVKDASLVLGEINGYAGCAVLRSGKVVCRGHHEITLRGMHNYKMTLVPFEIPGLAGIDEVTSSGVTACARKGGDVWCWGEASSGEAGAAALAASTPTQRCERDGDEGEYKPSATVCDRHRPLEWSRWAPPTRVEGISDAIAIATRNKTTCALRANRVLTCWGRGNATLVSMTIPDPPPPAAASGGASVVMRRGPALEVGAAEVIVWSASGAVTSHAVTGGVPGPAQPHASDVIDATIAPRCTLTSDGKASCIDSDQSRFDLFDPGAVRLAGWGKHACLLHRAGTLRCGGWAFATTGEIVKEMVADEAQIVQQEGVYALYADGRVRAANRGIRWHGIKQLAADGWVGCVITNKGQVECSDARLQIFPIKGLPRIATIGGSYEQWCAIGENKSTWCWPYDKNRKPSRIKGLQDPIAIDAHEQHACSITKAGELVCWKHGSPTMNRVPTTVD